MARIKKITTGATSTVVHPTEVDCEARRVSSSAGDTFLQLSTFGSVSRASGPKVSQTIQIDRSTALRLRELIDETFGF
jgi:hypothetical protein